MEQEAPTEETATATVAVVPIVAIVKEEMTVNETRHVQVPENTVGPMGGVPTVDLNVRAKQMGTSIH